MGRTRLTKPVPATPTWTDPRLIPHPLTWVMTVGAPRRRLRQLHLVSCSIVRASPQCCQYPFCRVAILCTLSKSLISATPARIEAYYNGGTIISPRRISADPATRWRSRSGEDSRDDRHIYYTDDAALAGTSEPQMITRTSIGQGSTWPTYVNSCTLPTWAGADCVHLW